MALRVRNPTRLCVRACCARAMCGAIKTLAAVMNALRSIIGSPTTDYPHPALSLRGKKESYRRYEGRAVQIFQLLIHSRSLEPAGFIAVLVDTTSIGLMVTKS